MHSHTIQACIHAISFMHKNTLRKLTFGSWGSIHTIHARGPSKTLWTTETFRAYTQYSTARHSTAQHDTTQHSTA
jgi:hypothetical protein